MNLNTSPRQRWLLWTATLGFYLAILVMSVSNRTTRTASVVLLFVVWLGLIGLLWRRVWIRIGLLVITCLISCFLLLPGRGQRDLDAIRREYTIGLKRYEGVTYDWGGENFKGIDCSGLMRRGLIDALFVHGLKTFDPGQVRKALWLWWHDCSAQALGKENLGVTVHLLDTPSINELDHSRILAGDMAVTRSGTHVMAYLGNRIWIEADPGEGRVVKVSVPSEHNPWFREPMKVMRWSILQQ